MQRRDFLKMIGTGVAITGWPAVGWSQAETVLPPYATALPATPFDAPPGTWTLVVLPDTQNMAKDFPAAFIRQTEWIVAHRVTHDIRFVVHEGDITNNNTAEQWANARAAMSRLSAAGVPYALLPGNHDLGPDGKSADRSTLLNDFFDADDYRHSLAVDYFESGKMENSWHELDTPSGRLLVVALEFGPRDAVLEWAGQVIADRPAHWVIVVTHAHIYSDNSRYDFERYGREQQWNPWAYPLAAQGAGAINDGEQVWQKLIARHRNIRFVLNGHVLNDGAGYLVSEGEHGQPVHQLLANYQAAVEPRRAYGGGGFLRLMQFAPDGSAVQVKTYSPWFDEWLTEPEQQFTINLSV